MTDLRDPLYLPSLAELQAAFPIEESFQIDSEEFPWVSPEFVKLQMEANHYQTYTTDFIESLAKYLVSRNLPVLEVGAGDGRLSYFLQRYIPAEQLQLIATDSMDWEAAGKTNKSLNVEKMGYEEAIQKYATQPTLILSSWMNIDVEWTADFRAHQNIKEYIMIGDIPRTAGYGRGWFLPENSGFNCVKLTRSEAGAPPVVIGSLGRFSASPHNPQIRSEVFSFRRQS